jgi:hypothetical protein
MFGGFTFVGGRLQQELDVLGRPAELEIAMPLFTEILELKNHARISDLIQRWLRTDLLVVTDTIVSFGPEQDPRNLNESFFGMSHLIGVLESVGAVTRAHLGTDPLTAPHVLENFHFDQHDLGVYDQIWLLGYGTGELPVGEQAAIADFMNQGGGVFATGDHAGLGSLLAGALPRVRSMRHWSSPPPATGADRIDTTRPDANDVVVFENQSDDIPQTLRLKWYEWSHSTWTRQVYPHPLLCSGAGPITEFPDHMHEGEVVTPAALDARISYAGNPTFDEYPVSGGGQRISPEIVAWGWTTGRADPEVMHGVHSGDATASAPRWSGTIGAYGGHPARVGRVVVHSTWHHIFDINLIGDNAANRPGFTDPRAALWRQGFRASGNGQRVLGQIDQYFRNIVHWLSPGARSETRLQALALQLVMTHGVRELLDGGITSTSTLGAHAWEYALRYLPPCAVMQLVGVAVTRPLQVLPWDPHGPGEGPNWPIPPKEWAQAALGGAVLATARLGSVAELQDERGAAQVRAGARDAVVALARAELKRTEQAHAALQHALDLLAKPDVYGSPPAPGGTVEARQVG